jgi:DNA-binding HxlR family transcriptional regulator
MGESSWKVVMDRGGVTISSDLFQLTTNGSEPAALDEVVSELQSVTRSTYGQYCGLARAAEMIGERWGLLVLRDLLVSPKTVSQLHSGLPRVSGRLLEMRLKEMAYNGVIRESEPTPEGELRYELTEYGRALEDTLLALGRWGATVLDEPRPEDIVTEDSLMVALRATFRHEAASELVVSYELHIGEIVLSAVIDHGELAVHPGPLPGADLVIKPGRLLKKMLAHELSVADALAGGQVTVTGDPALLTQFVDLFQLPKMPAPANA